MIIPEKFTITIPVFDGGQKWAIECWLRYRLLKDSGKLVLFYQMDQPRRTLEAAVADVWEVIEKGTGAQIYVGTAPRKKQV